MKLPEILHPHPQRPPLAPLVPDLPLRLALLPLGQIEGNELAEPHLLGLVRLDDVDEVPQVIAPEPRTEVSLAQGIPQGIQQKEPVDVEHLPLPALPPLPPERLRALAHARIGRQGGLLQKSAGLRIRADHEDRLREALVEPGRPREQIELAGFDLVGSLHLDPSLAEEDQLDRADPFGHGRHQNPLFEVERGEADAQLRALDRHRPVGVEARLGDRTQEGGRSGELAGAWATPGVRGKRLDSGKEHEQGEESALHDRECH